MIRVTTASRLHFGLFRVAPPSGQDQPSSRRFGGVGLMVGTPGLRLSVHPAASWSAEGPLAERALAFARRFAETLAADMMRPHRLFIEHSPPEHAGLGTGTQLGLAVARALAIAAGRPDLDALELAHRVGRGERSALGVHGFAVGGFLVEAGKCGLETVAPLVARMDFPDSWRIVLALPPGPLGLHGSAERRAFRELEDNGPIASQTDVMCRIVLLNLLPALAERNLIDFGESLHEFNSRAGESFAAIQGGTYASPNVVELVNFLRREGIRGVGQSSWGPAVFAVTEDEAHARSLVGRLCARFPLRSSDVFVTRGCNDGASVEGNCKD
jgi:beta-ribofuranosylaminobenzene 5'-phosphate synthase